MGGVEGNVILSENQEATKKECTTGRELFQFFYDRHRYQ